VNFIRRHYEKVILGAVLIFLVIAVALMFFLVDKQARDMAEKRGTITSKPTKPLPPLDLSAGEKILERLNKGVTVTLSAPPNNLFSPVVWRRYPDGRREKLERMVEGPSALKVVKITPLYMTISFDSVDTATTNYLVVVNNPAATTRSQQRVARYVQVGAKTDYFMVKAVEGDPLNPTGLVIELQESGETITIKTNSPFRRISGYMVDLRYEPERRSWLNRRVGQSIVIEGEEYTISAINQIATDEYEIVLSSRASGKKHVIKYKAGS